MERDFEEQATQHILSLLRKQRGRKIIRCLAVIVAVCTVYVLILPAITMSNEVVCGLEEHTHDEECWTVKTTGPQPELICEQESTTDIILHAHNSFCYDEEGELICTLPEQEAHEHEEDCYKERRKLVCEEVQETGHTHTEACYASDRGELTCEKEEGGGGHTHDDSCYETETKRVLICGEKETPDSEDEEGNVIEGHAHDDSCYEEETTEKLTCGEEESEGHTHDDNCYAWEKRLTCSEEEREAGHNHDDSCYDISQVLSCHEEEIIEHRHSDSCYDEDDELICDQEEIIEHNHTAQCVEIPEGESREIRVLICELLEHTHNDTCYIEDASEEKEPYLCGLTEHFHGEDCYFESGTLRCTMPEHSHDEDCLETASPEEVFEEEAVSGWISDSYEYDADGLRITFHIEGYAQSVENTGGSERGRGRSKTASASETAEDDSPAGDGIASGESAEDFEEQASSGEEAFAETDANDNSAASSDAKEEIADAEYSESETGNLPEDEDASSDSPETDDPQQMLENVEFDVETIESGREYSNIASCTEELGADEVLMLQVLSLNASVDGRELDLSQCDIEVEVEPAEELLELLNDFSGARPYTISEEGDAETADVQEAEDSQFLLLAYDTANNGEINELGNLLLEAGEVVAPRMTFAMDSSNRTVALTLLPSVYPRYTTEFYVRLDRPATSGGAVALPFIDTSSKGNGTESAVLPKNGALAPNTMNLQLDANGNVMFTEELTEVYTAEDNLFNPKQEQEQALTAGAINGLKDNDHYRLAELWVLDPGKDPEKEEDWVVYEGIDTISTLKFTNNPEAAGGNIILISECKVDRNGKVVLEHTTIRLIYEPEDGSHENSTMFYDYDISDGYIYTDEGLKDRHEIVEQGTGNWYVNTRKEGINSQFSGNGVPLAFGNQNGGTNFGEEKWNGNELNKSNGNGYQGCTFELAIGLDKSGNIIFNDAIEAPNLFGDGNVVGRTAYDEYSLNFKRQGDTYTLLNVGGASGSANNLDKFQFIKWNWNNTKQIWSNNFWPMDSARDSYGTNGHDPKFGGAPWNISSVNKNGKTEGLPKSDDDKNHNAYFGMNFSVEFTLAKEYIGPLEYYFYGDDDMWVFLDGELICDIGGVHTSVGEYVDLWDYIDKEGRTATSKHILNFFYTERGASGSTCWMQYTLPNVTDVPVKFEPGEGVAPLRIEKQVEGNLQIDWEAEYEFSIRLPNAQNNYSAQRYDAAGKLIGEPFAVSSTETIFQLKAGEYLEVQDLPNFIRYEIKENAQDERCHTSIQIIRDGTPDKDVIDDVSVSGTVGTGETNIVYTNAFYYTLPETGGSGTLWHALDGLLMMGAGCLWYRKKSAYGEAEQ